MHKLRLSSGPPLGSFWFFRLNIFIFTDFSGFEVGRFYRPVKETVTMRLDADVLHWLKQGGRGYQSRLNLKAAFEPQRRKEREGKQLDKQIVLAPKR